MFMMINHRPVPTTLWGKNLSRIWTFFFPWIRLGLCGIHLIDFSIFRCGFVNTSNFEITHLQGGVQGFTSILEKIRRILPQPRKKKSRQHQKRAHRRASNTGLQMALLMPGHVTKLKPSPAQYTHFSYSNLCVYIIKSLLNFADSQQHGISQLWRGYTSILQISIERSWR